MRWLHNPQAATIAQMNALPTDGNIEYAGHALMYGIDNSYHGDLGDPDTNAFGGTDKPQAGKGNFVEATVNMGDRTVTGNIFNVWEVKPAEGDTNVFKQDNLVNFKGDIFGNPAKGESNLAYGDKDKGAFKGSFYGDLHAYGKQAVRFYTETKTVTSRWFEDDIPSGPKMTIQLK